MIYDGYANKELKKNYFVRSLYFENNNYSNFNEKVDGVKLRHKYRIRTYSNKLDKNTQIFLELKGRENLRTYKTRFFIEQNDLNLFFEKKNYFKLKKTYSDNSLIEQFIFDCYRKNLSPKILVDYNRTPYINKSGLYFRLTFDNNIVSLSNSRLYSTSLNSGWKECLAGFTILEVKFESSIPAWFQRIVQIYQLQIRSISKFVIATDTLGLASDFEGK
jgi:SPX domain protein involved in polyphosphate accumulation